MWDLSIQAKCLLPVKHDMAPIHLLGREYLKYTEICLIVGIKATVQRVGCLLCMRLTRVPSLASRIIPEPIRRALCRTRSDA